MNSISYEIHKTYPYSLLQMEGYDPTLQLPHNMSSVSPGIVDYLSQSYPENINIYASTVMF